MTKTKKRNRILGAVMGISFLVVTLFAGVYALALGGSSVTPPSIVNANDSKVSSEEPDESQSLPEQTPPETEPDLEPVFSRPDEMRAVYLVPGEDFILNNTTSATTVQGEIDTALTNAVSMGMNSVVVDLRYGDTVIYKSELFGSVAGDFDALEYLSAQAQQKGLYFYVLYEALSIPSADKIVTASSINGDTLDTIMKGVTEVVSGYKIDGLIIENYFNETTEDSYASYAENGLSIGFENYMYQGTEAVVKSVADAARAANRNTQVGIATTSVWANKDSEKTGSETAATYQMLYDGHADVKKFVEQGYLDFISVKASGSLTDGAVPFSAVTNWWGTLAKENAIPMYVVHLATKACTDNAGWSSPDQLTRQVMDAKTTPGYSGSIFNSLKALSADPKESTTLLINYYNHKVKEAHVLKDLAITQPTKKTYSTAEPTVAFQGASDPNFQVTLNGQTLEQDDNGYIGYEAELKAGANTFVFEHKEKKVTYTITREVQVLKEISPSGAVTPLGGSQLTVTAVAYNTATVKASLNGQTITLKQDTSLDDSDEKDSSYCRFIGTFTMPEGTSSVQSLGTVKFSATAEGFSDSATGANIKVAEEISYDTSNGNGKQLRVTAAQAETFPTDTIDDYSDPSYHPLPKGTLDKAVSDPISYSDGKDSFTYYILSSGVRVYAKDIKFIDDLDLSDNKISALTVKNDGRYTTVALAMKWQAPYRVSLSGSQMKIAFQDTASVPSNLSSLSKNPLFSSATWSGSTLTLSINNGGLLGYQAYYNDNTLNFRFNNPAPLQSDSGSFGYTLDGVRIVLDPGHNDKDPGALGFYPEINEREINRAIAAETKSLLQDLGASVWVNPSPASSSLEGRMNNALDFEPHLLVCIHCNSGSSSAKGTESYYFNSFSKDLASYAAKRVSAQLDTANRGAKFSYFYMTRNFAFPATLTEYGFVSNRGEYELLASSDGQEDAARGTVKAIIDFFASRYNSAPTGTESTGKVANVSVTGVELDDSKLTVEVGKTIKLAASVKPSDASNQSLTWKSSKASVATVDENGIVTGVKTGTAKITVKTEDKGKTASVTITVVKATSSGDSSSSTDSSSSSGSSSRSVSIGDDLPLEIPGDEIGISVNGSTTIDVMMDGDYIDGTDVKWKSSNSSVVTVDENGEIYAKKAGTATITATTKDGKYKATCKVTVSE